MNTKDVKILNGATGTELIKHGFKGISQEKWILEHEDVILDLQKAYVEAGSDIMYTPTFGANRGKLRLTGEEGNIERYTLRLCELTKSCGAEVFGNIGPTGLFTYPMGETSEDELFDIYREQAELLARGGVDAFVIETMMTLEDALAAIRAAKEVSELPIIVSFTCNKNGRLITGTHISDALKACEAMGIDGFGLNCSAGPDELLENIKILHGQTDLPLLAKPNAGLPEVRDGVSVYDCGPEEFASYAAGFLENGVKYIGGCCGTTPEHIRQLTKAIRG